MRIIRPALVVACAALLALALAASEAQAVPRLVAGLRVVASFNPAQGQNPENLMVALDGTVYVTWLFAHAVVAVRPDGSQMAVSLPPGEATGIAIDPVADGRLTVGLISADPQAAGIWTVPLTAFSDEVVRFTGNGPVAVIADKAHQGVENPSAVAFGPSRRLFITSAAYLAVTRPCRSPGSLPDLTIWCPRVSDNHQH